MVDGHNRALRRITRRLLPRAARAFFWELPRQVGYGWGPNVMSALRRRWFVLRHPHARIVFEGPVYIGRGFDVRIPDQGTFRVGSGVVFRKNFRCEISGDGELIIGSECHFTYSVLIQLSTRIEIGARCIFGQSTLVVDGQHRFRDLTRPMLEQGYDFQPLSIGDDVTITTKCSIMADIGDRAMIGANSVVTRPIPAYCVAVGAPARPIDYFGPADQAPAQIGSPTDVADRPTAGAPSASGGDRPAA